MMMFGFKDYKRWYKNKTSNMLRVSFNEEDLADARQLRDDILDHCSKKGHSITVILHHQGELKISRSDKKGKNNIAIWVTGGERGNGGYLVSDV